ncbi:MAG: glycosyltransferase family 2 protein [Patescibacteria group bacterium]|jgi:glycosyltransferase involved in cell wall biosynthesis
MYKNQKIIVVMPAYNAAKTLEKTIFDMPKNLIDEIILVDDCSQDGTNKIAQKLGLTVKKHPENRGYGANQKTCYDLALSNGADIIIMLHPDYQYDPKLINYFAEFIADGYFDVILGSRIRTRKEALENGMPKYKYYSNRFLTFLENLLTGQNLSEWHTGMRAYRKEVLKSIKYQELSEDFVFDSQMLMYIVGKGYKIGEIPVPVRYFKEASSINLKRSLKYGLNTLFIALSYQFSDKYKK